MAAGAADVRHCACLVGVCLLHRPGLAGGTFGHDVLLPGVGLPAIRAAADDELPAGRRLPDVARATLVAVRGQLPAVLPLAGRHLALATSAVSALDAPQPTVALCLGIDNGVRRGAGGHGTLGVAIFRPLLHPLPAQQSVGGAASFADTLCGGVAALAHAVSRSPGCFCGDVGSPGILAE